MAQADNEAMRQVVLSLCDYSGTWGGQYQDAYDVRFVDLQRDGSDIRLLQFNPEWRVHGIIAQPPCDHFAVSGARWWAGKGVEALLAGLALVDACLRAVAVYKPQWWVLENPVGRLRHYIGPPVMTFNPSDYGDPYTKRTCLWGSFTPPQKNPVEATEGSKMHLVPPGPERKNIRSATPEGFAKAFRLANP